MKRSENGVLLLVASLLAVAMLGVFPSVASASSPGAGSPGKSADPAALSEVDLYVGHVGYVVGVIGLASQATSSGSVSIYISGIPSGSTIVGAFLFWDVVDNYPAGNYASLTFALHSITGTLLGGTAQGDDPCYTGPPEDGTAPSYTADVTSEVTGNGLYVISESWPLVGWPHLPFADGLGLVVFYSNPLLPNTNIYLDEGFGVTSDIYSSETSTLSLSPAASGTFAQTTYIFGDTQNFYAGDANIQFLGTTVLTNSYYDGPSISNNPTDSYAFIAAYTLDVTSLVPSGTTSVSFGSTQVSDCLVHVAQVFQYTPATAVSGVPEFGAPGFAVAALVFPAMLLLRFFFTRRSRQIRF